MTTDNQPAPETCKPCKGKGKVPFMNTLTVECKYCGGSGMRTMKIIPVSPPGELIGREAVNELLSSVLGDLHVINFRTYGLVNFTNDPNLKPKEDGLEIQKRRLKAHESICKAMDLLATVPPVPATTVWQPLETIPRDGTTFRAYSPELVHADFNPWGSVECVFNGEEFIGAVWDGQFDCWNTVPITPTLWMPIENSPAYSRKDGPQ